MAKITAEKLHHFYWHNIIYRFRLFKMIVFDNKTHFVNASEIKFYKNLGIPIFFISIKHSKKKRPCRVSQQDHHIWHEEKARQNKMTQVQTIY